jgi:hypothetical protein
MRKILIITLTILLNFNLFGQGANIVVLETENGRLEGTLLVPDIKRDIPVALIIAGSGPTDRNGNNPGMKNNSLKMLAEGLTKEDIASLRYDKRGIGKSRNAGMHEDSLRFEHYIQDARDWIELLQKRKEFNDIIVIGHSQGSLIGMIASRKKEVKKFISIAGSGESVDKLLLAQLKSQPPYVMEDAKPIIEKLKNGQTVDDIPQYLYSLFRPSVQPYVISQFKYDPCEEIAKLDKQIMIIQGTTDLQIRILDANLLAMSNPNAEKHIIKGMNHIMKNAESDRQKNLATYNQPDLPLTEGLVDKIVKFIKN